MDTQMIVTKAIAEGWTFKRVYDALEEFGCFEDITADKVGFNISPDGLYTHIDVFKSMECAIANMFEVTGDNFDTNCMSDKILTKNYPVTVNINENGHYSALLGECYEDGAVAHISGAFSIDDWFYDWKGTED